MRAAGTSVVSAILIQAQARDAYSFDQGASRLILRFSSASNFHIASCGGTLSTSFSMENVWNAVLDDMVVLVRVKGCLWRLLQVWLCYALYSGNGRYCSLLRTLMTVHESDIEQIPRSECATQDSNMVHSRFAQTFTWGNAKDAWVLLK